jgi:hypothetical protein
MEIEREVEKELVISETNLPPFDMVVRLYINHYLRKLTKHMLPASRWKYLIMITEVIHLLVGSLAFTAGLLLPPTFLPYNILLVSLVIFGWQILGYCFVTKIVNQITGEHHLDSQGGFLVPFSETFLKIYGSFIICLSIFFTLKPEWAPFSILKPLITNTLYYFIYFFQTH